MTDSGSPETGTENTQKPGLLGGWSDDRILDHLEKRGEAQAEPQPDEEPAGSPDEEPRAQKPTKKGKEPEAKPDGESEEGEPEKEAAETEPDEDGESDEDAEPEEEWTPGTVEELAQALEMDPKQLLGALKAQAVIDGQPEPVTLQEAIDGYQRQADYSRNMQALKAAQEKFNSEMAEGQAQQQQRMSEVDDWLQALWQIVPQTSDADLIAQYTDEDGEFDNLGYFRAKAQIDDVRNTVASVYQQLQQTRQQQAEQQQGDLEARRQQQQQLLVQKNPDFGDMAKVQKFQNDALGLLREIGFSDGEVQAYFSGDFDHRYILLLDRALKQDKLEKGKKDFKELKAKPRVTKPGSARSGDQKVDRVAAAKKALRKARSSKAQDKHAGVIIDDILDRQGA